MQAVMSRSGVAVPLDDAFANEVLAAHGLWKLRLHDAITTGSSAFSPEKVGRDDACAMGSWLHGAGRGSHGSDPRYAEVLRLHADFHREASSVLRLALDGDTGAAMARMDEHSVFFRTSMQLITIIDGWRRNEFVDGSEPDVLRETTVETLAQLRSTLKSAATIDGTVVAVAAAVEEMSASIGEISASAATTATNAEAAVRDSDESAHLVDQLRSAAADIEHVVRVIKSIAEQTNMLALNATIEAARAGAAGGGFAVVANAVKELARKTASATLDVGEKIHAVRETAEATAANMERFGERVRTIAEGQLVVAAAVEEQSAVTHDISSRMQEAAAAGHAIKELVDAVQLSTQHTYQTLVEATAAPAQIADPERRATRTRTLRPRRHR